jgi:exportin-7
MSGNFILEYTYLHPNLQPFVIVQLAQVFAMLTKLGWFDLDDFKNVHRDLNQFLQVIASRLLLSTTPPLHSFSAPH